MSHPAGLPDLFIDRSLGRLRVRQGLRAAGQLGWAIFMKDGEIRRRPAERQALVDCEVRAFCRTRQDLPAEEMVTRFLRNLPAITAACSEQGPFIYAVQSSRLDRLRIT